MGQTTDPKAPITDLQRYESVTETLEAILESALQQGDQLAAAKLQTHIAWNRAQIERLRTPAASA